jgi:hypothetical protein
MSDEFALGDARRQRATEWAGLGDAERDRVAAVILTGMSPSEAKRAIARIRTDGRTAADETVRRYHTDTADRMDRLLRQALAARWEAAERAVVEAIDPDRLPPLEMEEEVLAFVEFVVRAAEPTQALCDLFADDISARLDEVLDEVLDDVPSGEDVGRAPLERLVRLWGLPEAWLEDGIPADRAQAVADLAAAAELLDRRIKRERVAAVVRRPAPMLGGRSLYELAQAGEHAAVRAAVDRMFDLRRSQP